MTPDEFVQRVVGTPWVRWRSDFEGMDCFGCVSLFYREVRGIDVGVQRDEGGRHGFAECPAWGEQWRQCDAEPDATCFMAWRDGAPTHCGVVLSGDMLLHAEGSAEHPGSVKVTRLAVMRRLNPDIRFYRFEPTC